MKPTTFSRRRMVRDNEELRGILNAGHRRGGAFIRTVGEDFEPRGFKVFAPVAYAWLVKRGVHVSPTLEDRSITIELRRRLPTEEITRLRSTRTGSSTPARSSRCPMGRRQQVSLS